MALFHSMTEMIGGTPLLALERLGQKRGWRAKVLAKLEYFNPAGSVKDRAALGMIQAAEKEGRLRPGAVIVEPTSGNTGIGLAAIAAVRGYRVILTMPETMSLERRKLLTAYGAEIILTPGEQGMQGAIDRAEELLREIPGSILAGQFDNRANPAAHYASTGPEIWRDTEGQVDIFVAGVGSGGTVTGVARCLKERRPAVEIVAAEPAESPVLSGGAAGPHGIQGIGGGAVGAPGGVPGPGPGDGPDRGRAGRVLLRRGPGGGGAAGPAAGERREDHRGPAAGHRRAVSEHGTFRLRHRAYERKDRNK